jgi:hypothetical protein
VAVVLVLFRLARRDDDEELAAAPFTARGMSASPVTHDPQYSYPQCPHDLLRRHSALKSRPHLRHPGESAKGGLDVDHKTYR